MADFEDVVKTIEESEKRVDEVLKAAKLERHERQPMGMERLTLILNYLMGGVAMVLGFAILFFIIYLCGGGQI